MKLPRIGYRLQVLVYSIVLFLLLPATCPLLTTYAQGKHIEVDLTRQELFAYDGNTLIYDFPISSGTIYHPTVTGTFYPWIKLTSTTMIGGSGADYYNLPGVPYTMYFYQGYGLHGTYWHHNFGHPMSHGCVNLPTEDARLLFYWTDFSTPIHIYGVTPSN